MSKRYHRDITPEPQNNCGFAHLTIDLVTLRVEIEVKEQ
jgi:hypothetical protein